MDRTSITSYIDGAQVAIWLFWLFFIGLILYLRKEDKREGYPLLSDRSGAIRVQGFPTIPAPKTFIMPHGAPVSVPRMQAEHTVQAAPIGPWPGAPLDPLGDPLRDGVGPAAYAVREDVPEMTFDGHPMIVPLRVETVAFVAPNDADPRGMTVFGRDNRAVATVVDIWTDRSEPQIRYLEMAMAGDATARRLLPMGFAKIVRRELVHCEALSGAQFAGVPVLRNPDQITKAEEDRIMGYYGGGDLYAKTVRLERVL